MTDTLNKPVKDEVRDEHGATKHNQGASKYDKETGDGLCYGARNARVGKPLSHMSTTSSLFGNQTNQVKLEQAFSNSTEMLKNPSSSSTLSNNSSPARVLRPSTGGHIPVGPATAAALSASVGPFRYPLGPLPMHSSSSSKMLVLNNDSSAFVPHSQQHFSSINCTLPAFSATDVSCSGPASGGLIVNTSPNTSPSVPLHSVMTSALSTVATTTSSAPRLSELAPSQPSFPLIHSTGGAFHLPASALSAGSLVVRQSQKPLGMSHNSVGTVVSNPSGSKCSSSVVSVTHGLGLIPATVGFPSSDASVITTTNKIGVDIRAQHLSSSSFSSPTMSSSMPTTSSHNHQKERSTENPLGVDKFSIPGLNTPGGQSGIGSNSSNVVLAYSDIPVSFQPCTSSISKSSASVTAALANPMTSVPYDRQSDFSLSGHTFLTDRSGMSCTGSSGNLAVIGGGRQQRGQIGQQLQQQTQPLPGTLFGLMTRTTIASSQPGSVSPSASPRPAPTILRKRTNEGHRKLEVQSPDCRLTKVAGSISGKLGSTEKPGVRLVDGFLLDKVPTSLPGKLVSGSVATFPILASSTGSSPLASTLKQTSENANQALAVSLLGHLQAAGSSVKQTKTFGPFSSLDISSMTPEAGTPSADASPRKKPRKQHFVTTDDQYASNVPLDEADDKCEGINKEVEHQHREGRLRTSNGRPGSPAITRESLDIDSIYGRRSQLSGYRLKAPHNHFLKYTDVRRREERTLALSEICSQRGINKQVSGWKLVKFSRQLDELADIENEVMDVTTTFQKQLPPPTESRVTPPEESEIAFLTELVQGDVERSKVLIKQMQDVKLAVKVLLDHSSHIGEILQKHTTRKPLPFSRRYRPEMIQHL